MTQTLGFDCIATVYHSYLQTEFSQFEQDLMKHGVTPNWQGLLDSLEDVLYFIKLRREDLSAGVQLEDFWKELPVKISLVKSLSDSSFFKPDKALLQIAP